MLRTGPFLHPYLSLLRRAIDISSAMRVGVYDCLYVALASERNVDVVTFDRKLVAAFAKTADGARVFMLEDWLGNR